MRTLLQLLVRYSNFLLFIMLEVVAFILVANYNKCMNSVVWSAANRWIASVDNISATVVDYFQLRKQNEQLIAENALLHAKLMQQQNQVEEIIENNEGTYVYSHLNWNYIPAKIIAVTTYQKHNYLTLNKGARDSVSTDMGVICPDGVVGIISAVGEQYSLVVPIIHTEMNISSRIQRNGYIVGTSWNGYNCQMADLTDVSRHIELHSGDTIVTSGLTPAFPEGIPVGVVQQCELREGNNYYEANIKLTTDYRRLRYVQVIYNTSLSDIKTHGMD